MKRLIWLMFFFLILIIVVSSDRVIAQTTPTPTASAVSGSGLNFMPGITCGNATSDDSEIRKCCRSNAAFIPREGLTGIIENIFGSLQNLPAVGQFIKPMTNFKDYALQLQRNNSAIACPLGYPSTLDPTAACTCLKEITPSPIATLNQLCSRYFSGSKEEGSCNACANASGVWTSLGCVYGDTGKFIKETVFVLAIGLAGTIALICIIYAAFSLQISQGNPEKIKKAQELLTSCIMGLMLIIFSVFILRLIGVSILKIPGFG